MFSTAVSHDGEMAGAMLTQVYPKDLSIKEKKRRKVNPSRLLFAWVVVLLEMYLLDASVDPSQAPCRVVEKRIPDFKMSATEVRKT